MPERKSGSVNHYRTLRRAAEIQNFQKIHRNKVKKKKKNMRVTTTVKYFIKKVHTQNKQINAICW